MERIINKLLENSIFVAFLGALFLLFLYEIQNLLFLLLIAFILVIALRPAVLLVQKTGLPYKLSVPIIVVLTVGVLVGLGTIIVDGIAAQVGTFSASLQEAVRQLPYLDQVSTQFSTENIASTLFDQSSSLLRSVTSTVVNIVIGIITVVVITIYWLLDYTKVRDFLLSNFTNKQKARRTFRSIEHNFGGWVRGQFAIMLIIGTVSYIAYLLIGLPAALALAVIAGLLEVVPTLGPVLAAIPAILIGLTVSPQIGIVTLIANIAIQQLENQLVAPKIMQRAVNLHPIAVIVILFIGNLLFGLIGVLLSVPFTLLVISIKNGYFTPAKK